MAFGRKLATEYCLLDTGYWLLKNKTQQPDQGSDGDPIAAREPDNETAEEEIVSDFGGIYAFV